MSQVRSLRAIQDKAWGYGYKEGLKQLRGHMLEHLVTDPKTLNLASLEPDF